MTPLIIHFTLGTRDQFASWSTFSSVEINDKSAQPTEFELDCTELHVPPKTPFSAQNSAFTFAMNFLKHMQEQKAL